MEYTLKAAHKFLSVLFALFFFTHSCKKADIISPDIQPQNFTEKFFAIKTTPNALVAQIIAKLKTENNRTGFVNRLPQKYGLPIWEKAGYAANANTINSFSDSITSGAYMYIPMSIAGNGLSSIIVAHQQADTVAINFYSKDYLYSVCHEANSDTAKAESILTLFFAMENYCFGTTVFHHIPANLFKNSKEKDITGNKIIRIKDNRDNQSSSSLIHCVTFYHCINSSPCSGWYCDRCTLCETTICHNHEDGPPGGGGSGGGGSGSGSGSGSGGGGGCSTCYPPPPPNCEEPFYLVDPCGPPPPPPIDTILNPCAEIELLINSPSFKSYLQEIKDSTNSNREYGYFLIKNPANGIFGHTPTGLLEGEANELSLGDFNNSYSIDGITHGHFDTNTDSTNGLSVYSPEDLWTMSKQFNSGNIINVNTFTMSLVTKKGTQYILMIKNLTKFRTWAQQFTIGEFKFFAQMYEQVVKIKRTNTVAENEKRFLLYLKSNQGSGLELFRGNSSFTDWTPIRLDSSNNVITTPCN